MSDKKGRELLTVLGKPHTGKTTLLKKWLIDKLKKPIFIVDPQDEFSNIKGATVWNTFDEFYKQFTKALLDEKIKFGKIHVFKVRNEYQAKKVFTFAAYHGGECSLIVDEVDRFMSKHKTDEALHEILHYGAHNGISLATTSRRIQNIHNDLLAFSEYVLSFAQTWGPDEEKFLKAAGSSKGLKGLKAGEFLCLTQKPEKNNMGLTNDRVYKLDLKSNKLKEIQK